jgi:hypothetical protein
MSGQFGLVGALIGAAVAGFACAKCGKIEKSELPADVRSTMARNSVLMVVAALVVLAAAIGLMVAVNS